MYIDSAYNNQQLVTWVRDEDDVLHMLPFEPPYYFYTIAPNGPHRSIYGDPLAKVEFSNYNDMKNAANQKEVAFESDIAPLYKHLSDDFYKVEGGRLHIGLFDIEVEVDLSLGEGYPNPDNPYGAVNSISLFDCYRNKYHLFLLRADNVKVEAKDGLPVVHHYAQGEVQLLNQFLDQIEDIDVLSAWFGDGFDVPYLIKRLQKVMGNNAVKALCRGGFSPRKIESKDDFENEIVEYQLVGRPHLDMLKLYKNFTFGEEKPSFKLDAIAELEIGERKIEYSGDLGELYRNDPQTFYEYSLHDTYLLKKLNDQLQHIDLAITMSREATIKFTDIFGSIKYIEQSVRNYCHYDREEPLILPDKDPYAEKEKLQGAIVYKTREGVHPWCMSIDLTALYPSVIVSLGISPETMIMQCANNHDDFIKIVERRPEEIRVLNFEDNEIVTINADDLKDIIEEEGFTLSANGTIFNGKQGIISEVVNNWFQSRVKLKAKMKEAIKAGDKEEEKLYNIQQMVKKISVNSIYGAMANPYCRFYDIDIAKSITYTGQEVSRYQAYQADQAIERRKNIA